MPTTIAVLDEVIPEQIRTNPQEMVDVRLVWSGTSVEDLEAKAPVLRPGVLILDLDRLGPDPIERTRRLQHLSGADLVLILYKFAKRDVVGKLAEVGTRPMKAPISLASLRTQMMSVIVKNIFKKEDRVSDQAEMIMPGPPPPARIFTPAQLGHLQEITSAVDCECPNHLSDILQRLQAFEDYSLRCQNKDDKDAQLHHMLYIHTGQARNLMEEALRVLVKYENIDL
jgi:hypothetical protein